MLFSSSTIAFLSLFTSYTLAAPYNPFPLPDGFPSPNPTQLNQISKAAGGSLPNSPLPTSLTPDGVTTLQLIALNEIFEVAFFTDLLYNVTNKVPGYEDTGDFDRDYVIDALTAIQNVRTHSTYNSSIDPNAHIFDYSTARKTPLPRRKRHPRLRQRHPNPTLQIHIPNHLFLHLHSPRQHLHRRRHRRPPPRPNDLRFRRWRRDGPGRARRVDHRAGE